MIYGFTSRFLNSVVTPAPTLHTSPNTQNSREQQPQRRQVSIVVQLLGNDILGRVDSELLHAVFSIDFTCKEFFEQPNAQPNAVWRHQSSLKSHLLPVNQNSS